MTDTTEEKIIAEIITEPLKRYYAEVADRSGVDIEEDAEPVVLEMNGVEIETISELREYFVLDEAIGYVQNRTLYSWLKQLYYEREADAVRKLRVSAGESFSDRNKRELCGILGIDYENVIPDKDRVAFEKHTEAVKRFTTDETILKNSAIVALNQKQLAKLLNDGEKKIYLCHNEFSIPLKITGINYIGVDKPVISNALTAEQYKMLCIRVENIRLPRETDSDMEEVFVKAAKDCGYDISSDECTEYENDVNRILDCEKMPFLHHITDNSGYNSFKSKYDCEKAREEWLRAVYDEADSLFNMKNEKSLYHEAMNYYTDKISKCYIFTYFMLGEFYEKYNFVEEYEKLGNVFNEDTGAFKKLFSDEIKDNASFYRMYDFNYFLDKTSIRKENFGVDSDGIMLIWDVITGKGFEYSVEGFSEALNEINNDVERLASTYINTVHNYVLQARGKY